MTENNNDNNYSSYGLGLHGTWKQNFSSIENSEIKVKELESKTDHIEHKISDFKNQIEEIQIDIIQIVAIVVAILGLILGNVLGVIVLPGDINIFKLIGFIFIINGIALMGISFLIFLIKLLFLKSEWKNSYFWFFIIPINLQVVGLIIFIKT